MNKQPLLIVTLCFILGIFFQDKMLLTNISVLFVALISVAMGSLLFFHSYFLHKIKAVLLSFVFFGAGIILHFFTILPSESDLKKEKGTVVFRITQKLNSSPKYKKYEGVAEWGDQNFNSILYLPKTSKELDFIHYYQSEAFVTRPYPPQYNFQFDYARYLRRKNIQYQIYVSGEPIYTKRDDLDLTDRIRQLRLEVLKKIDQSEMSVTTKEFLKGIILADRTGMDADTVKDFNRSGLVHFLAISGTHIVVIFGMFYFLMMRWVPLRYRYYTVVFSLIFIWLFAAFIGFGNSVLRSCIMLSTYFIFVLLQRKPDLLHSLALSALIILIMDTQQIFDVGFQLSFIAVLGIFWLNQPLLKYFPRQDDYLKKLLFNTITISLSAQLATLPLVLYYFHQFSFISIVANFVIVPFSEVIIVFSFLLTALIAVDFNFIWISKVYDYIIQILLKVIHWFSEADIFYFENIPMNIVEVFLAFMVIFFLRFAILRFDFRNSMRFAVTVLLFLMIRTGYTTFENQKEEIILHDFGKKKIFSIKNGSKTCFWISDMAEHDRVLQFIVKPYCASRRVAFYEIKTFPSSAQKAVFKGQIYDVK
ncbi:ComEC/Rec2 family competence protein [Chryseobacterium sp. Mn2064]|uniref:ComEC/Rec2 family competence protein n=1 Tax=Chryseobacterium sp. Mn2064 TaxID=3395263 RepID=UPI003BCD467A